MRKHYLRNSLVVTLVLVSSALVAQTYYGAISPESSTGQLDIVESTTGASVNSVAITMTGLTVKGITGMAHDPVANITYVLVKHDSVISLAQINLITGELSNLVGLSEKFAGLAFAGSATLYGITGDGSNTPETVYSIDPVAGTLSLIAQPGTGSDGEALAYNTTDGLLYRYGGGQFFQSIDPGTSTVTDIFLSHPVADYAHALYYDAAANNFIFAAGDSLYELATDGTLTGSAEFISTDDGYKGLLSTSVTGIDEEIEQIATIVFPNPARENITVAGLGEGKWEHEVLDVLGRVVLKNFSTGDRIDLDTSRLAEGKYTLVSKQAEKSATSIFVIQR